MKLALVFALALFVSPTKFVLAMTRALRSTYHEVKAKP